MPSPPRKPRPCAVTALVTHCSCSGGTTLRLVAAGPDHLGLQTSLLPHTHSRMQLFAAEAEGEGQAGDGLSHSGRG
eukprot:366083-Chlamydomonas_euryale.AAC.17